MIIRNKNNDFIKFDLSPVIKMDIGTNKKIKIIGKIDLFFLLFSIKKVVDV